MLGSAPSTEVEFVTTLQLNGGDIMTISSADEDPSSSAVGPDSLPGRLLCKHRSHLAGRAVPPRAALTPQGRAGGMLPSRDGIPAPPAAFMSHAALPSKSCLDFLAPALGAPWSCGSPAVNIWGAPVTSTAQSPAHWHHIWDDHCPPNLTAPSQSLVSPRWAPLPHAPASAPGPITAAPGRRTGVAVSVSGAPT